jgi:hypothetical protein
MRFMLLSTDYPAFLTWLYTQNPDLGNQPYEKQAEVRAESLFSLADFYSSNLRVLGHEAWDIDANNEPMQKAWGRQHGLRVDRGARLEFRLRRGVVPWVDRVKDPWFYDVLAAQIEHYKPDVLLNHAVHLSSAFLREMKPHVRLMVGSHASPIQEGCDLRVYDLMLSLVENFVDCFRRKGLKSELLRSGFEPRVLSRLGSPQRSIPVSFVGNLFASHASRIRWLEEVCDHVPVQVWTASADGLPPNSTVRSCRRGTAWGTRMFELLRKSMITLNHHIDVAGDYAGNLRLFEATGTGCLLVTDWKMNLGEMFEPGKEVVVYRTPEECIEAVRYYLDHPSERESVARAGQERTLRDHTYHHRMVELVDIVQKYLQ